MKPNTTPANGSAPGAPPIVEPAATVTEGHEPGSRSPTVTFAKDYDHDWPSRAVTAYKAGWSGKVKAEVAEGAAAAGALESPLDGGGDSK